MIRHHPTTMNFATDADISILPPPPPSPDPSFDPALDSDTSFPLPPPPLDLSFADTPPDTPPPPFLPRERVKFVTGAKNSTQAIYKGYIYTRNGKHKDKEVYYWACKDRKKYDPPCKGRMTTEQGEVLKESDHCHEGSEDKAAAHQVVCDLRSAITTSSSAPRNLVNEILLQVNILLL